MNILIILLVSVIIYQTLWWAFSQYARDNSWVDVAWGIGFIVLAKVALWQSGMFTFPKILVFALVGLWGCRLAFYILFRKHAHPGEDKRYVVMRTKWGRNAWWMSLFTIFWLQGILILVILTPVSWLMQ